MQAKSNADTIDVSVVVPTYRREDLVGQAVRSALAQQGVVVEVIVMDDAPGATARSAVASIGDARITYVARSEPSGGRPARVRNDGAHRARGRYVCFLDDDDLLEPGALAMFVKSLDARPDVGMAFGVVTPFGDNAARLLDHEAYFRNAAHRASRIMGRRKFAANQVYCDTVLINSACIARRSVFEQVGGFDEHIAVCEDADLWARMALASDFIFLNHPVVRYRTGAASIMNGLARNDPRLPESYRRIRANFVASVGRLDALFLRICARLFVCPQCR